MAETPAVLLGSAATPWPVPGCGCRTCLAGGAPEPTGLRIGDVVLTASAVCPGAGDPVEVMPGDALERSGIRIAGLPAAGGAVALVTASRGAGTVLWAPEPALLPAATLEALAGAGLTIAALAAGADGEPLARSLALLRRAGALADRCDVVAIGLDHQMGPGRLAARLASWGARLAPDGAPLGPAYAVPAPHPPRRTLVLGPASSGKSAFAESLLAAEPEVDYLPTGEPPGPEDGDWSGRIAAHRRRRPAWWRTLEGAPLARTLATAGPPLLLDSLGTWVSAALGGCGAWDDACGWQQAFDAEVDAVVGAWRQAGRRVVAVAEEAGWGVVPGTPAGRQFRDALGAVNRRLAAEAERVLLVVAGRATELGERESGA